MIKKLKNPVWYSLKETHKKWSVAFDNVTFYDPNICPFGAFTDETKTAEAINKYLNLTEDFFLVSENKIPTFDNTKVFLDRKIDGCQMIFTNEVLLPIEEKIIRLTKKHSKEIYNLIWLVMPGYYREKTMLMGEYYGIIKDNKLVAIAGMRMQTDDFIELSAVVTHPNYTRKGYAKQLSKFVTDRIIQLKKLPILHTNKGNSAIKLYENLGYQYSRDMNWWHFLKK